MPTRIIDYSAIAEAMNPDNNEKTYVFSNGRTFWQHERYSSADIQSSVTGLPHTLTYYIGLPDWG